MRERIVNGVIGLVKDPKLHRAARSAGRHAVKEFVKEFQEAYAREDPDDGERKKR